jgi:uncharacterized protein (DUF305 family)
MSLFSSDTKTNPFADAEESMHHKMMKAEGETVDETFVLKMIEHHRGGIEMGGIHMEEGSDPTLHDMVRKSMAHQEKEIQELESWLSNKG